MIGRVYLNRAELKVTEVTDDSVRDYSIFKFVDKFGYDTFDIAKAEIVCAGAGGRELYICIDDFDKAN